MRYHGNYCGPNWSAGRHQASVVSDVSPIDEFDRTCQVHDAAYATGSDLDAADRTFVADNLANYDITRWLAAAAVGGQVLLRSLDRSTTLHPKSLLPMVNHNLRGARAPQAVATQFASQQTSTAQVGTVSAPATIGSVIRGTSVRNQKKHANGVSLGVSVCVGRPSGAVQTTVPEMVAVQYLMPVCLGNDEVQNMTRVYQHYRITKATVHFRSFQGTAAGGEVIMISNDDPNFRPVNTAGNSSFYQRALTSEHALLTPLWCPASMELAVDKRWKVCDNSNSTTLEEFCSGVLYLYEDGATAIPGYFLVDMQIEFEGLRFNSRNLISGSFQGLGVRQSTSIVNTTANGDSVLVGAGFTTGDVYAVVLSTTNATFGIGHSASTIFVISSGSGTIAFTITGSTLVYGRASSSTTVTLYTTYDSAVGGDTSDKLIYGVTAAVTSTFPSTLVAQLRNSTQPST